MDEQFPRLHEPVDDPLFAYLGQVVVLDTQGPLVYIGTLRDVRPDLLLLADADVHDGNDSRSSKDLYLLEARDLGVHPNRTQVIVQRRAVVSASLLEHVRDA